MRLGRSGIDAILILPILFFFFTICTDTVIRTEDILKLQIIDLILLYKKGISVKMFFCVYHPQSVKWHKVDRNEIELG